MKTLTDWRTLDLPTGRADIAEGLDPARIRALDEYRRTRSIVGVWLATTEELSETDDDESADLGPAVEAIDWTGFAEALAALRRAVAAWGDRSVRSADDVAAFCDVDVEPRVALHNDPSRPTCVHEMTAEEVALCHHNIDLMDDDIRNALDGAGDDDREWLALYAARHEAAHGTPWCLP